MNRLSYILRSPNSKKIFSRTESSLAVVFWIYFVVGTLLMGLLYGLVDVVGRYLGVKLYFDMVSTVFLTVYYLWVFISLWLSAFNAEWKGWGYLIRILVGYLVLYWLYSLF